jgi:hypothetical protein
MVVGLVATALLAVVLVALVRQGLLVGRTALRLGREIAEVTAGMGSVGRGGTTRR